MRIALVSPYALDVPGGVQSHVLSLADALLRGGDDVRLIAPGPGDHTSVGPARGIPFNGSVAPIAPGPAVARRTIAALRAFGPDVVHVHEPLVPVTGVAAATGAGDAAVVATFHASSSSRWLRAARPLGRRVLAHLDDLIAVSDAAARTHAAMLGVDTRRFHILPNGVDVRRFSQATPRPSIAELDGPTLLFVGRLEPRKGLDVLVRAYTLLKTRYPDLQLVVVGEGPQLARSRALLPDRLSADLHLLGKLSGDELPGVFRACDIFVAPSRGGESFGIVLLEAMAAGCAVVASAIDGYRTVVTDGVDGRLVVPENPSSLAEAIGVLLDNPSHADALIAEGRRRVEEFDWQVVAAAIRARYVRALEHRERP